MSDHMKTYPAPWEGALLLACRKCQKKLKGDKRFRALAKLRKTVKRLNQQHPGSPLHVINVGCMDLCPRHAVTICDAAQNPEALMILRSEDDLQALVSLREGS
ncbi:MAG TPA: hypothetical protein VGL22_06315 [Terracidiphilus sp.]|jgi:predicted metal-binding protein